MANERERTAIGSYLSDEYQTPPDLVERFRAALGGTIGLDPCYSSIPGHRFQPFADVTWGLEDEPLRLPVEVWQQYGSIYVNMPYSDPTPWAHKIAICESVDWLVLSNSQTCAKWWHVLARASAHILFPRQRIAFVDPLSGQVTKGNRYDSMIFTSVSDLDLLDETLGDLCEIARIA